MQIAEFGGSGGIVPELVADRVDLVCSAATVTSERQSEIDFCSSHLNLALAVVKRAGMSEDTSIQGLRVGVRRGATAEAYAKEHSVPEPAQISESNEHLYISLAAGELDAVIDDSTIAQYFANEVPGLCFTAVLPGTEASYAIMVRKGNHMLLEEINTTLGGMERDGTLQTFLCRGFDGFSGVSL